jgi:hypothetical protein
MREILPGQPDRRTRTRPASSKTRYAQSFYEVAHDMITLVHASNDSHTSRSSAARPAGMGAAARVPGTPSLHGVSCSIETVPARDPTSP